MQFLTFEICFIVLIASTAKHLSAEPLRSSLTKTSIGTYDDDTKKLSDFFMGIKPQTTTANGLYQTTTKPKKPTATISLMPQIFPSATTVQQVKPNYHYQTSHQTGHQTGYQPVCQQVCMLCTPPPVRPTKPYTYDMELVRSLPVEIKEKLEVRNLKLVEQLQRRNDDGSQEKKFVFNNGLTLYQRFPQAEIEDEVEGFYLQRLEDNTFMTTYYKSNERDYYAHSDFSDVMPDIAELNAELTKMLQKQRDIPHVATENLLDI